MAGFDTTGIIKLFTNNKFRLIALILVLIFLGVVTFLKVYYSTDDCKPLIEQNKILMEQNTQVMQKNTDLVQGYLKIEGLLGQVTHDTIYVNTTTTLRPLERRPASVSEPVFINDSVAVVSNAMEIQDLRPLPPNIKKNIVVKPGNGQIVVNEIQKIIDLAKKK